MSATVAQLQAQVPGLAPSLRKVFAVAGDYMAGAGVLTLFLANGARQPRHGPTSLAIASSGALTGGVMSVTNFALGSDFRWLSLVPALALYATSREH